MVFVHMYILGLDCTALCILCNSGGTSKEIFNLLFHANSHLHEIQGLRKRNWPYYSAEGQSQGQVK